MRPHSPLAAALASCVLLAACGPAGETATESTATGAQSVASGATRAHQRPSEFERRLASDEHGALEPRRRRGAGRAGVWQLGALFAVPPGQSVVEGGTIPYLPAALEQRDKNRAAWPANDPETKCYRAGIPRSTYMPYPFQIVQGDGDIMFVYEYATSNRPVRMSNHLNPQEVLVDQWLGWSNGRWEGDTLVIDVFGQIRDTWLDRAGNHHNGMTVEERYTPMTDNHIWYEATITDPRTFSRPWKIAMPLYRRMEPNAEIYEYKCVEFAEPLLYGELLKEPIK